MQCKWSMDRCKSKKKIARGSYIQTSKSANVVFRFQSFSFFIKENIHVDPTTDVLRSSLRFSDNRECYYLTMVPHFRCTYVHSLLSDSKILQA